MKPDPPLVLNGIMAEFARYIGPELRTSSGQGVFGLGLMVLGMIAQHYDRASAILVEEDEAIASLLKDASYVADDAALKERVRRELDAPRHANLRISALEQDNARLRALLIDVHSAIEATGTPEARDINERIWAELQESTRRRHVVSRLAS